MSRPEQKYYAVTDGRKLSVNDMIAEYRRVNKVTIEYNACKIGSKSVMYTRANSCNDATRTPEKLFSPICFLPDVLIAKGEIRRVPPKQPHILLNMPAPTF